MKISKAVGSIVIALCLLLNTCAFVLAENEALVSVCSLNGNTLTISGFGEDIRLLVLNPGKTVSDLKSAGELEKYKEVVNYTNTFNVGKYAEYEKTVTINNFDSKAVYTVYVKDKTSEFSKEVGYIPVQVYVSKNAQDAGDGSIETPFSSIEEARDFVRTLDKTSPIEIILRGGEYNISSEIIFTDEDSGREFAPITYKAAEGERVILNGSTKLDISKISRVTDGNILGRVDSKTAQRLVEIDLEEQGIPKKIVNYLSNHLKGWYAKPMGVYLNGESQNIARWPNTGYATIKGATTKDGISTFSMKELDSDRIKKWANAENMYIEGYLANFWAGEWAKVESIDIDAKTLKLAESTTYGVANNMRAAAVNLLEEIDVPGEWYANPETMKMYYYPPYTLTENDTLEIATLERNFISIEGAKYINIEGVEFIENANSPSYFDESPWLGNGILVNSTSNIEIRNCKFKNIGMGGVFVQGSRDVIIDSCSINNTGYSGVMIKQCGDIKTLTGSDITISNSYITAASRDSARGDKAGIHIGNYCIGVTVENNVLSNMKNSAIRYYGNSHTIRNNEIYNCVKETSDAGAIYAGRSWSQYGTVINNNYFHHIGHGLDANGASALFLDDAHSGDTFTGNIVDMNNVELSSGIAIAGGRDIVVTDNIFVNALYSIRGRDRNIIFPDEYNEEDSESIYNSEIFQTFKWAAKDTITNPYYITEEDWLEPFRLCFPGIMVNFKDLTVNKLYNEKNTITDNISYNSTVDIREKMTTASTIERNYTPTDSNVFVDAKNGDYRLTNAYKASIDISDNVPDEDFSLNSIGIQSEFEITDSEKAFNLMYPLNEDIVSCENINLKWSSSDFADRYVYEIATDVDFTNIVKTGEVMENVAVIDNLQNNTKYYWRVTAVNKSKQFGYQTETESVFSFRTADSVTVDNIKYERANSEISYRIVNNKSENETVKVIVALKDAGGRLIEVKTQDVILTAKAKEEIKISTEFKNDGPVLELYVWDYEDGLKNITAKHRFIR